MTIGSFTRLFGSVNIYAGRLPTETTHIPTSAILRSNTSLTSGTGIDINNVLTVGGNTSITTSNSDITVDNDIIGTGTTTINAGTGSVAVASGAPVSGSTTQITGSTVSIADTVSSTGP